MQTSSNYRNICYFLLIIHGSEDLFFIGRVAHGLGYSVQGILQSSEKLFTLRSVRLVAGMAGFFL